MQIRCRIIGSKHNNDLGRGKDLCVVSPVATVVTDSGDDSSVVSVEFKPLERAIALGLAVQGLAAAAGVLALIATPVGA